MSENSANQHKPLISTVLSANPATGELLGEVQCTPLEEIPQIFKEARKAQKVWAAMSFSERGKRILKIRDYLLDQGENIARVISKENGKTIPDAFNTEILPSIMSCDWYAHKAESVLKEKIIPLGSIMTFNKRNHLLRIPYGVVGIISPWNYPFAIPFGEIIMGLMAGNAILFKVARETPLVGVEIEKAITAAQLPKGLCQHIVGSGSQVATSWFENGIDKIFLTGSVGAGKTLMRQAIDSMTPLSLELGGNDPMIVLEDAPIDRAVNGAIWAGFQNCGQSCGGVERVYVHESIAEEFLAKLKTKTESLRQGVDRGYFDVDLGCMTTTGQLMTVKEHVDEALAKGARIFAQSKPVTDWDAKLFYPATVLVDVTHDMLVMREETFGPVLGVMTFKTEEEVIRLANDSHLGLTSSVWTMDTKRGRRLAEQLETGVTTINDHLYTHGGAELPWIGWKQSGTGATHSHLGLVEMTKAKLVNYDIVPHIPTNLWWFPVRKFKYETIVSAPKILFGSDMKNKTKSIRRLLPQLMKDPQLREMTTMYLKARMLQ
ncbi:MAG: aldehyde dehydrogenase family protein [SAR324 cluster bacterium]|nr:aldehyde dehydrogenase family protein [SAR324 cluster bacterium]MBF0352336.1 aldehyde dehydrogenase family protein [SAR324 cluster bacterium]